MIRTFDLILAFLGLLLLTPILLIIYAIGMLDTGAPIFQQTRVGHMKKPFNLLKFRTMRLDTPSVATHLIHTESITSFGNFLRRTKLDELPQLWNVFIGDMSLVGPRPGLYNQEELITERDRLYVYEARPGITGKSQVKKIDMSTPALLARTDADMIASMSVINYFKYIALTLLGHGSGDRVKE
jgi:O-antigen biosynthesis protein WbqP